MPVVTHDSLASVEATSRAVVRNDSHVATGCQVSRSSTQIC